jgi:hypothetical protein
MGLRPIASVTSRASRVPSLAAKARSSSFRQPRWSEASTRHRFHYHDPRKSNETAGIEPQLFDLSLHLFEDIG